MASRKKRAPGKRRGQKSVKSRIVAPVGKQRRAEIRELSKFVPSLEKLKGKKGLTSSELGQLNKAKKSVSRLSNLHPITERQAKQLKKQGLLEKSLTKKGIRAIHLRNTSADAKVKVLKSGIIVTSNGRDWEYHPVGSDPNELYEYGSSLLKRKEKPRIRAITIWLVRGRMDEAFTSPESWLYFLENRFIGYAGTEDFVLGIAARRSQHRGKK